MPGHRGVLPIALVCILAAGAFTSCQSESPDSGTTSAETRDQTPETRHQTPETRDQGLPDLSPAETVVTMMTAYLDKRLGEYYSYVAAADREVKTLDSLQAEFAPNRADIVTDFLFANTEFSVDSVQVLGDSAIVYTTATAPPVPFVIQQAQIIERDLGPDTDMKTKLDVLGERHRLSGAPQEENHGAYLLVKETPGWRVVVGWADMAEALRDAADPPGGT